jgi:hypothetical protein
MIAKNSGKKLFKEAEVFFNTFTSEVATSQKLVNGWPSIVYGTTHCPSLLLNPDAS